MTKPQQANYPTSSHGHQASSSSNHGAASNKNTGATKQIAKLGGAKKCIASMLNHIHVLASENSEKKHKDASASVEKYTSAINNVINVLNHSDEDTKIAIVHQVEVQKPFLPILSNFRILPFESKKHMLYLFQTTLHYFSKDPQQMKNFKSHLSEVHVIDVIFGELVQSNDDGVVNNLSEMIKECVKYLETCELVIQSKFLLQLMENFTSPNTNISTQAFFTFRDVLKSKFKCVGEWTKINYDKIQQGMIPLLLDSGGKGGSFMYQIFVTSVYQEVLEFNEAFKEKFIADLNNFIMLLTVLESSKAKNLKASCLTIIMFFFSNVESHYIIISNISVLGRMSVENLPESDSKAFNTQLHNLFSTFLSSHLSDPNLLNYLKKYHKAIDESKVYQDLFLTDNSNLELLFSIIDNNSQHKDENINYECLQLIIQFLPMPTSIEIIKSRQNQLTELIRNNFKDLDADKLCKQVSSLSIKSKISDN